MHMSRSPLLLQRLYGITTYYGHTYYGHTYYGHTYYGSAPVRVCDAEVARARAHDVSRPRRHRRGRVPPREVSNLLTNFSYVLLPTSSRILLYC